MLPAFRSLRQPGMPVVQHWPVPQPGLPVPERKLSRLTISKSDGSRFIKDATIHVPGSLHGPSAHGQYVL